MNDAPVTDLLRQAIIKTDNHLMDFSDSSWQDCPDTDRIIVAYSVFHQGVSIDHGKHVPGQVAQSSAQSEYNLACTEEMDLSHFRMQIHDYLKKDRDIVQEEAPLIVLDSKYTMCMAKNGKNTKHTSHISRRMHFVRNG